MQVQSCSCSVFKLSLLRPSNLCRKILPHLSRSIWRSEVGGRGGGGTRTKQCSSLAPSMACTNIKTARHDLHYMHYMPLHFNGTVHAWKMSTNKFLIERIACMRFHARPYRHVTITCKELCSSNSEQTVNHMQTASYVQITLEQFAACNC